jgi:hypothetical protein
MYIASSFSYFIMLQYYSRTEPSCVNRQSAVNEEKNPRNLNCFGHYCLMAQDPSLRQYIGAGVTFFILYILLRLYLHLPTTFPCLPVFSSSSPSLSQCSSHPPSYPPFLFEEKTTTKCLVRFAQCFRTHLLKRVCHKIFEFRFSFHE